MGLISEFKEFALKGNVVDMAIGVIIGAAFKDIVTSFTDSFINPLIASVGGAEIAGAIRLPWVDYTGLDPEQIAALSLNYGASSSSCSRLSILLRVALESSQRRRRALRKKNLHLHPSLLMKLNSSQRSRISSRHRTASNCYLCCI